MTVLRRYAAEIAVTLAVLIGSALVLLDNHTEAPSHVGIGWALTGLACASLFARHRYPLPVAGFTLLCCAFYYPLTNPDGVIILAFAFALYNAAAAGHIKGAALIAAIAMAAIAAGEAESTTGRHVDNFAFFLMTGWFVALVAGGAVTHYRRDAERSKEAEALRRETEERLRLARGLHDVLGHHLALINVQASAALHRKDPAQTDQALGTIKSTSKEALHQLRATLGMLRQVDVPGLANVGDLVAPLLASGLAVRTEIDGSLREVPPEVDLAAFRMVQEALTNVTRHAAASAAVVRIRYTDHDVSVQIDDDGSGGTASPGNGLRGMAERARALGGEFAAFARPEGGFRVQAKLPL